MKVEVSASVLLTIAVTLLSIGVNYLEKNNPTVGVPCIIVGFGLILATVFLIEEGVFRREKF